MTDSIVKPAHVHIDPLGGLAGDMFNAAMLDAWPALEDVAREAIAACDLPAGWHVIHGRRLSASIDARSFDVHGPDDHVHAQDHGHGHGHGHGDQPGATHRHDSGRYAEIKARISDMRLSASAIANAQGIYARLAECEAVVHGIAVEDVHFHELADFDSVVDIVTAGALIAAVGSCSWSVSSVPLGNGTVRTAHGPLPVPAPATSRLLRGFDVHDDGIGGERVTPTGAAILSWLFPDGSTTRSESFPKGTLGETGCGAGMRQLKGCANIVRVQAYHSSGKTGGRDTVGQIEFDVDDQTPEELAATLSALRADVGIIDVVVRQALGKKGRAVFEVRVLCDRSVTEAAAQTCLAQSSSLGVRVAYTSRRILARSFEMADVDGISVQVKVAVRPDGSYTAKAEHDAVASESDHAARRALATAAEAQVLSRLAAAGQKTD
jgi:pyridinium-3,5-bisthiocarboxylic acid mononucleotide nickel chelatase